ncbi:MAG: insulinase family protein [Oscillospiraceae bacterium]|nr:insulinase family protein [Oscillospiraceae bacterium]
MKTNSFPNIGETVYSTQLENGLNIAVVPKKDFATNYAVFATNYGGAHRRFSLEGNMQDTPAGIAHFLEHKMFDMPDGDNALNQLSANGADPNAFTSSAMTCYYFHYTHSFEDNLRLLLRFVSTPYFTDETVDKEQGIIAQEIRMGEDNPGMVLYYNLLGQLYENHPLKDRVAGTVESISHISAQTLYDCHKVFYAPSNMCLCVEGDVDPERIAQIAREELTKEKSPIPRADFGSEERLEVLEAYKEAVMEVSAPQFLIGAKLKCETEGNALMRQQIVAQLALRLLCGASSPFYTRLYSEGILNRDFDYEADFGTGAGTVIIGGESPEPRKVLDEFNKEVERICREGFDEGSFIRAKRASAGARLRALEDFENVCVALVSGFFEGYCPFEAHEILHSVSKEECESFVKENLSPSRLALSVIHAGR